MGSASSSQRVPLWFVSDLMEGSPGIPAGIRLDITGDPRLFSIGQQFIVEGIEGRSFLVQIEKISVERYCASTLPIKFQLFVSVIEEVFPEGEQDGIQNE